MYSYPICEVDGLIWIWPGKKSNADPSLIPCLIPGKQKNDSIEFGQPFFLVSDLDIDFSLMVENLLDPAHIPFTHEGTIGRRKDAKPLLMDGIEVRDIGAIASRDKNSVMAIHGAVSMRAGSTNDFYFIPPCTVALRHSFGNGWQCKFPIYT